MTTGSTGFENPPIAIADAVFDQVRRAVPQGVACDLALDTSLYEVGLDSIARMDVLNCLEEAFELRFSEEALYDMETCRDVVEYIETSISHGSPVRGPDAPVPSPAPSPAPAETPAVWEICPKHYDVTQFPECVALEHRLTKTSAAGFWG